MTETTTGALGFFIKAPGELGPPSPLTADNIDPTTRDFASLTEGADVIDAQVQLAMTTVRNSGPSVENDGIRITSTKMDAGLQRRMESDVRLALRRLVRQRDIRITSVVFDEVDEANQFAQIRVRYQNLRAISQRSRTAHVPVPGQKAAA